MPRYDQLQCKETRGTRCLGVNSVNPWCDRPQVIHFEIWVRHLLHMSCKTRVLHGMITTTTLVVRLNKDLGQNLADNIRLIPIQCWHYMVCLHGSSLT